MLESRSPRFPMRSGRTPRLSAAATRRALPAEASTTRPRRGGPISLRRHRARHQRTKAREQDRGTARPSSWMSSDRADRKLGVGDRLRRRAARKSSVGSTASSARSGSATFRGDPSRGSIPRTRRRRAAMREGERPSSSTIDLPVGWRRPHAAGARSRDDAENRPCRVVGTGQDVTERRHRRRESGRRRAGGSQGAEGGRSISSPRPARCSLLPGHRGDARNVTRPRSRGSATGSLDLWNPTAGCGASRSRTPERRNSRARSTAYPPDPCGTPRPRASTGRADPAPDFTEEPWQRPHAIRD
jgi:hypothetical protein